MDTKIRFGGSSYSSPTAAARACICEWATGGGLNSREDAIRYLRENAAHTIDEMRREWQIDDDRFGLDRDELIGMAAYVAADLEQEGADAD